MEQDKVKSFGVLRLFRYRMISMVQGSKLVPLSGMLTGILHAEYEGILSDHGCTISKATNACSEDLSDASSFFFQALQELIDDRQIRRIVFEVGTGGTVERQTFYIPGESKFRVHSSPIQGRE